MDRKNNQIFENLNAHKKIGRLSELSGELGPAKINDEEKKDKVEDQREESIEDKRRKMLEEKRNKQRTHYIATKVYDSKFSPPSCSEDYKL